VRRCLAFAPIGLLLALAGCAADDGRLSVSGEISLQGAPLSHGSIEFLYTGDRKGAAGGAMIKDGKYVVPKEHGLQPGVYRVVITSPPTSETSTEAPGMGKPRTGPPPDRIPAAFNTESEVTVEVKPGQPNVFDFKIP
jgi:hypothetical protein